MFVCNLLSGHIAAHSQLNIWTSPFSPLCGSTAPTLVHNLHWQFLGTSLKCIFFYESRVGLLSAVATMMINGSFIFMVTGSGEAALRDSHQASYILYVPSLELYFCAWVTVSTGVAKLALFCEIEMTKTWRSLLLHFCGAWNLPSWLMLQTTPHTIRQPCADYHSRTPEWVWSQTKEESIKPNFKAHSELFIDTSCSPSSVRQGNRAALSFSHVWRLRAI